MMRLPRAPARALLAGAALACLLLFATAGPAAADHAYSHRYITYGRIVDADGNPVQGKAVQIQLVGFDGHEGLCPQDRAQVVTDEMGDFYQCDHVHSAPNSGRIVVTVDGKEHTYPSDPDHRDTLAIIRLDETVPVDPEVQEAWNRHYRVGGIVWREVVGRTSMEGIGVNGLTIHNASVTVRLDYNDGKVAEQEVHTDVFYGRFEAVFNDLEEALREGTITVTSEGTTVTQAVDPLARFSHVEVNLPKQVSGQLKWTGIVVGGIVGLAVVGGGGAWAWSRFSEARETKLARERSTRRRARK